MRTHARILLERSARFNEARYGYRSAAVVRNAARGSRRRGGLDRIYYPTCCTREFAIKPGTADVHSREEW
jgi:hypothetical protein